jgi:alpha-ribazole phosphatase
MIIKAIRHTRVDITSGICYGITDVPLTDTFDDEATQILEQLKNQHFDIVFSSPLSRCTKLVSRIFPETMLVVNYRLKELNFGDWEMQQWDAIFNYPEGKIWFEDYINTACPNGESLVNMITRAKMFLDDLEETKYEKIALVTHAGMIRALMCLVQHKTPEEAFQTPLKYGEILNFSYAAPKLVTRNSLTSQ